MVLVDRVEITLAGRSFKSREIQLIKEITEMCSRLERGELIKTIYENVFSTMPDVQFKKKVFTKLLVKLESDGVIKLPSKKDYEEQSIKKRRLPR